MVPDIDPARTWLISDTHFGHRNITKYSHRPPAVDSLIVQEWITHVPSQDTVLHLGDLTLGGGKSSRVWFERAIAGSQLPGNKLLILGNHDRQPLDWYASQGFQVISPFEIIWRGRRISFSHYPWNNDDRGSPPDLIRIHGHIHNNGYSRTEFIPFLRNHINVSIEQMKYRPVNLEALLRGYLGE